MIPEKIEDSVVSMIGYLDLFDLLLIADATDTVRVVDVLFQRR